MSLKVLVLGSFFVGLPTLRKGRTKFSGNATKMGVWPNKNHLFPLVVGASKQKIQLK